MDGCSIVHKLGFEDLSGFIKKNIGIDIIAEDIYIRCDVKMPLVGSQLAMNTSDILSIALEQCEEGNQISQGYNKSNKYWHGCNTSRNILKSQKWADIFTKIGAEYSLFLLKNTVIIQKIADNYVLLCGNILQIINKNSNITGVSKEVLFYGRVDTFSVDIDDAISCIINDIEISKDTYELLYSKIVKVFSKYEKLPLKSIFKSYIIDKYSSKVPENSTNIFDYEIKADIVANFLFLISKKILRPVFNYKSFKILKGKLVLLLKRNLYENIGTEELINHFKISDLKLFNGIGKNSLSNTLKTKIITRLMAFLFKSVYLKIVSFFFYSTTTSFSKMKIYYFTRIDWNQKTNDFFKEHLKTYDKCSRTPNFATLRCIPKENGYRVITNCSRINSHNIKKSNQMKNISYQKNLTKEEFNNGMRPLSIPILNTKYSDINDILINNIQCRNIDNPQNPANIKNRTKYLSFNSVNSATGCLLPIIRNVAIKNPHCSLLRHVHIDKKLIPYLQSNNQRKILLKIDLEKCFDNIPQNDLLQVLDILLTEDHYNFRDLCVIKENTLENKIEAKYLKLSPEMLYPMNMPESQNDDYLQNIGIKMNCIIKENKSKIISKIEIMKKLKNLIKNTTVIHQNQCYKSKQGIPQGCIISSLLCSIYYAFLDQMFPTRDCFISRYVDDFLIISTDINHIKEFLKIAESLKDKGFVINKDKIRSNIALDSIVDSTPVFVNDNIEWCGLKIYDTGVNIKSICRDPHFRSNIFVYSINRGARIFTKIKKSVFIKLNRVCICKFNKKLGECIFDLLYFSARRLKIMILRCSFINDSFIEKILRWCVDEVLITLQSRGITFDRHKIENIANSAFEKCGIRSLNRRKFQ